MFYGLCMWKDLLQKIDRAEAFKWIGRTLSSVVLLVQVLVLNQYLVQYENNSSLHAFTLAYGPAVFLWAKGLLNDKQREVAAGVCFLYIIPMCIETGWILGKLLHKIGLDSLGLDHGFLNYPLAATALMYVFLDAEEFEPNLHMELNWAVIVDILDVVNLNDVILDKEKNEILSNYVQYSICAFTILSLAILTFTFARPVREALQNKDKTNKSLVRICSVYSLVQAMVINFPFLVIRLALQFEYKAGSSVFALKNLLLIVTDLIKVCSDLFCERKAPSLHTPTNTEDSASVVHESTHLSHLDDASSISSSVRRPHKAEEKRRSRLFQETDDKEDPKEIIVLS